MDRQPVTIELRQEDNNIISKNGDYEANVAPVTLNDGDSITVSKVFLDTRDTGDGEIVIAEAVKFHYEIAHYIRKLRGGEANTGLTPNEYGQYGLDNTSPYYYNAAGVHTPGADATIVDDGAPYVPCFTTKAPGAGHTFFQQLEYVICERYDDGLGGNWGGVDLTLNYTRNGSPNSQTYHVPTTKFSSFSFKKQTYEFNLGFPILYDVGTTPTIAHPSVNSNNASEKYNIKFTLGPSNPVTGNYAFTPIITGKDIRIEAGAYTPTELCEYMNREFQKAKRLVPDDGSGRSQPSIGNMIDNVFLRESDSHLYITNQISELDNGANKGVCLPFWDAGIGGRNFVQATTTAGITNAYGATVTSSWVAGNEKNIWTGASDIELNYDADANRFFFKYIHTPYFGDSGSNATAESVGIQLSAALGGAGVGVPKPTPGNYKWPQVVQANATGGVIFTKMTASVDVATGGVEGNSDFVSSVLGFDGSQVAKLPVQTNLTLGGTHAIGEVSYPKWDVDEIQPGVCLTEGFAATDSGIYLGPDQSTHPYYEVRPPAVVGSAQVSTVTTTTPINATNTQDFSALTFGYYLVEIQTNFLNNFIAKTANGGDSKNDANMRSINSVVGRYYSKNSYTQSDGGLVYQHKGAPITVDSFRVRVLDSNKEIPTLGEDNTVFLQVVRA